MAGEPVTCPACGVGGGVPIIRGLPDYEDFLAERRGELVQGGCLAWEGDPQWHCRECGQEW